METPPSTPARRASLLAKYADLEGRFFMTGVQALVRLSLDHARRDAREGLRTATLISGYQGSPLGGLDIELQRHRELLSEHHIQHQPALNEELAATAILGSQLAHTTSGTAFQGVSGIWYGKAPGLDRATDAIRHGNVIGVDRLGGAVVVVGDDALSKSSTLASSSETALFDMSIPFLAPADPQEVLDLGLHAIALSRASGLWSGLKIATNVADGSGTVSVGLGRVSPVVPEVELDGQPYRHRVTARLAGPQQLELERTLHLVRIEIARSYNRENGLNRTQFAFAGDRVGIVAAGKTYLELRSALAKLGLDEKRLKHGPVRLLKVSMPFPLDHATVREFAAGLEEVIVVEDKRAFLELLIKDALHGTPDAPTVVGKVDERGAPLIPPAGEADADVIAAAVAPRLRRWLDLPPPPPARDPRRAALAPAPMRLPWFCSGCPHNSSTRVPQGTLVGGGIGCHGMVLLMSPERVGEVVGLTQMGGEGAQWIGMAPFVSTKHFVQNVGDGTFLHSGSLSVRAAVAAGVNVTFKILQNSAVAMTGGQEAVGKMDVPRMTRLLESEGVRRTIVTTDDTSRYRGAHLAANAEVWERRRLLEAQKALSGLPGVTALIHDQECAAELRRKRKRKRVPEPRRRVFINERVCEGCGDCGKKSNCLSVQPVETEFGRKTQIHQASCNKDLVCLEGDCPAFVTVIPGDGSRRAAPDTPLDTDALPDAPSVKAPVTVRIVGVGGTGVVTVAQILGTAALIDGFVVRGLDQTGLAQKGGPVVSDLKILADPAELSNKASRGECDLYLGCDALVAADARYLSSARAEHTVAVVSTAEVATGPMVIDSSQAFPPIGMLRERIDAATSKQRNTYLDARRLATDLFGNDSTANVMLLGAACQLGTLPVSPKAIEQAIELNGVSVKENLQAFRRGRQWVGDPAAVASATGNTSKPVLAPEPSLQRLMLTAGVTSGSRLERLLEVRTAELRDYQNMKYAKSYVDFITHVHAVERSRVGSSEMTEAVAGGLFKLMAFKDEYEVARLHLDARFHAAIREQFGDGARIQWHLHPPILRALGLRRKLSLGRWFTAPYRLLRVMRRLRFTPFDPFARAEVRKVERALIAEYRSTVEELLAGLSQQRHALSVQIANLPEMIRGYEEIKLRNVSDYHERVAELMATLQSCDAETIQA